MRKYLYAGAVAGCFLLLGAAPAQADVRPAPQGTQHDDPAAAGSLDELLGQALGGSPLIDVNPGDNAILPPRDGAPAARTGLGTAGEAGQTHRRARGDLPLAGALSGGRPGSAGLPASGGGLPLSGGGLPTGALSQLPIGQLLAGRLPLIGGLLPDGQSPIGGLTRGQEAGLLDGGLPLLGGLGGLLPASDARTVPALSGLPAGGTPITDRPARTAPAKSQPARPQAAADPAVADDARLHEEPTDPEDRTDPRAFSPGRPVAGPDPEFH